MTGKHVLIAVTVLLCVAVVVAGFVVGLFFLKQTSDRASDNMTKVTVNADFRAQPFI